MLKTKTTVRAIAKLAPFKNPKAAIAKILAFSYAIAMAKFATASDALTAALAVVDARLTNINTDEQLDLYIELIDRRAKIQEAIALGQLAPAFTLSTINLGAANAATIKASAGAVYSLKVTNKNASVRYFQLVNKATTPTGSDSALIVDVIAIPPNAMVIIDSSYFGVTGLVCSIGVSWAFSSTDTTITLATAGDIISTVGYL